MPNLPTGPDDDDLLDTADDGLPGDGLPRDVADTDDVMDLLGQLDEPAEDYVTDRMIADVPGVEGDASPPMAVVENPQAKQQLITTAPPPRTQEVRTLTDLQTISAEPPTILAPPPEPVVDIRKQFEQFDAIAQEVIQGTRHDRQETQDAINLCRGEIQKSVNNGQNPSRMWVDNLTKALEIKATVNLTAIKALEAKAKLLAATKAGIQVGIQNNNQQANVSTQADNSLVDLLNSNPLDGGGEDEF